MLSKEEMKALEEIERCIGYDAMISVKSISILYTLYMKEKEKNKELKEKIIKIKDLCNTKPYVAYTLYGDLLYESYEILELLEE